MDNFVEMLKCFQKTSAGSVCPNTAKGIFVSFQEARNMLRPLWIFWLFNVNYWKFEYSSANSQWWETVQVFTMWQVLSAAGWFAMSYEGTHWWETLQMYSMWQVFWSVRPFATPHEDTQWCKTLQMHTMWQALSSFKELAKSHVDTQWRKTLQM